MRDYSPEAWNQGTGSLSVPNGRDLQLPSGNTPMHGGTKMKDQADKLPRAPRQGHHVASGLHHLTDSYPILSASSGLVSV